MTADPAPREDVAPQTGVSWQDLFNAADGERLRSDVSAQLAIERAHASDQQSESHRETSRGIARAQRRRAAVFKTMAILIGRAGRDGAIQERLREIALQEAAEAEACAAEAASEARDQNSTEVPHDDAPISQPHRSDAPARH